jgi:hypothetical protein
MQDSAAAAGGEGAGTDLDRVRRREAGNLGLLELSDGGLVLLDEELDNGVGLALGVELRGLGAVVAEELDCTASQVASATGAGRRGERQHGGVVCFGSGNVIS